MSHMMRKANQGRKILRENHLQEQPMSNSTKDFAKVPDQIRARKRKGSSKLRSNANDISSLEEAPGAAKKRLWWLIGIFWSWYDSM